ncbi:hypothetical protein SAMN06298212_10294 [Ruaniaceae bacterium KH17]|nr:hypothetical protein SAMN06298212_10294 [Ruaniaceae bacterium KH17]
MNEVDRYLQALDAALAKVPLHSRQAIADDVRAHIADALEEGREPGSVLAALGAPEEVARAAREELGEAPGEEPIVRADPATKAQRLLLWAALAIGVVTAVLITFLMPMYEGISTETTVDGVEITTTATATLFEEMGIAVGLIPLLPAALVLLPLLLPERLQRPFGWGVAAAVTVFSVIAGFTIGAFYLPMAFVLWAAMLVPVWIRCGRHPRSGLAWRVAGALAIALPVVLVLVAALGRTVELVAVPFGLTAAVVLVVAVLFGMRRPYADVVAAVLGAGMMLAAVLPGDLLMMAFWWTGGLWLTIGLSAIAARISAPSSGSGG